MLSKTQTFFVWLTLLIVTAYTLKFSTNTAVAQDVPAPAPECPPCPLPPPCPVTLPSPDMGAVQRALATIEKVEKTE